ncbi:MAG: acyltransferase [candidate division KSB1 bacterium]|nr:acyltransferase [candidate division KSB1 bacterium]
MAQWYQHESAFVSPDAIIGADTKIWHGAQIREFARIGDECIIGKDVYIDTAVVVGNRCKLQNGVYLYNPTFIEDGVFVGPGAMTTNDKLPRAVNPDGSLKTSEDWVKGSVRIKTGASIGAGAIILPSVTIGSWAMVGAGSVVTRDVPDHALVAGNPAKIIGYVCKCGRRVERAEEKWICPECELEKQFNLENRLITDVELSEVWK